MGTIEDKGNRYYDDVCPHSYADTSEQLREDVVAAYVQSHKDSEKEILDLQEKNQRLTDELAEAKEMLHWFIVYEKGEGIITNFNNFIDKAEEFVHGKVEPEVAE